MVTRGWCLEEEKTSCDRGVRSAVGDRGTFEITGPLRIRNLALTVLAVVGVAVTVAFDELTSGIAVSPGHKNLLSTFELPRRPKTIDCKTFTPTSCAEAGFILLRNTRYFCHLPTIKF